MPENAAYYHAAYISAAALYGGYALTLWWRAKRIRERAREAAAEPGR